MIRDRFDRIDQNLERIADRLAHIERHVARQGHQLARIIEEEKRMSDLGDARLRRHLIFLRGRRGRGGRG